MTLSARVFLFDFDGTLVDSGPLHAWAFREVLATAAPTTPPTRRRWRGNATPVRVWPG